MNNAYDVVVIGGRVAGSTTALYAARAGLRVLVIDNGKTLGRAVQCGEFLPDAAENFPEYPKRYDEVPIPWELKHQRTEWLQFFSPRGNSFKFRFGGATIDRDVLDQHIARMATDAGAEYLLGTAALSIEHNDVVTRKGRFTGRVIVVASGPGPRIPTMAGLPPPTQLYPAVFCVAEGPFGGDTIDVYFGDEAPGGYAWVIPKGRGAANVGVGMPEDATGGDIRGLLEKFLSRFPGSRIRFYSGGNIPLGGMVDRIVHQNRISVGDAAGMVMPSNGGGILCGLISGQIAGMAIGDHVRHGQPLMSYQHAVDDIMGKQLKISRRRKAIYDVMFNAVLHRPLAFEMFHRSVGSLLIEKAFRIAPLIERMPPFVPSRLSSIVNSYV